MRARLLWRKMAAVCGTVPTAWRDVDLAEQCVRHAGTSPHEGAYRRTLLTLHVAWLGLAWPVLHRDIEVPLKLLMIKWIVVASLKGRNVLRQLHLAALRPSRWRFRYAQGLNIAPSH